MSSKTKIFNKINELTNQAAHTLAATGRHLAKIRHAVDSADLVVLRGELENFSTDLQGLTKFATEMSAYLEPEGTSTAPGVAPLRPITAPGVSAEGKRRGKKPA